jgi:CheY-like chemotaxis protein
MVQNISDTIPTIAVVDDDGCFQRYMQHVLGERYLLMQLRSAEELLALLGTDKLFDLILVATELPGMSGAELCELLKEDGGTCDIPVIFLSRTNDDYERKNAFGSGGDDFLLKDIEPLELHVVVEIALDGFTG